MSAFAELGVMPEITQALEQMDWLMPTEIQAEAIPLILGGGDVLMASETGTGKTGAFCIPIVQVVYEQILECKDKSKKKGSGDDGTGQQVVEGATPKGPTKMTLSINDRDPGLVLNSDLLMAQSKSGQWQGCRANKGVKLSRQSKRNNRIYYEVYFSDQGLARVGWSLSSGRLELGLDRDGWGYGGTAKKSNNKQFADYGQTFGEKFDIVGCILNLDTGEMSFTKNGRNMGVAFKLPVGKLDGQEIFPTICVKNAGCQVRFGPVSEKDDYKPKDCTWISEMDQDLVLNRLDAARAGGKGQDSQRGPLAIILEPSRELGKQTFDCCRLFSKDLSIQMEFITGGPHGESSEQKISDKNHILVSTPGKLAEVVNKGQVSLNNVHFFILDEADGLIQQGHEHLIRSVASKLPRMFASGKRMQTICCSATLHNILVKRLAQDLMYFPTWIDLKGEDSVPDTVHHVVLRVDPRRDFKIYQGKEQLFKTDGVHEDDRHVQDEVFLKKKEPSSPESMSEAVKLIKFHYVVRAIKELAMDQGIIFCRTKLDCDNLGEFLDWFESEKYSNVRLHSGLSQQDRTKNLEAFKRRSYRFLICTDVAARGIDVRGVPFVIQVTLPDDKANYIHRIGRVGRAERMGLAISLVATEPEKVWYHICKRSNCSNTKLVERGGCCKWFDELAMLAEIEEHLKCSIQEIGNDFKLQVDEFDGKVVYGSKRLAQTSTYEGHVEQLKSLVSDLTDLESKAQANFIKFYL